MFLYAEDYSGVEKSGVNIADLLVQAIDEVGPSNIIQVLTNNASNCKVVEKEVEKVHPPIFWYIEFNIQRFGTNFRLVQEIPFHVSNKRISFRPRDPKKSTPSVPRSARYDVLRSRTTFSYRSDPRSR